MNNRLAVTIRMNMDEQKAMRELLAFWGDKGLRTPQDIIKFAFEQLYISQKTMEKKLKEQADAAKDVPAEAEIVASANQAS